MLCAWLAPTGGTEAADPEFGLGRAGMISIGVCEVPGGGKLGGGIDVSMVGSASAGDGAGAGAATGVVGAGDTLSMGANLATEAEASLLRAWSLLRDGIARLYWPA